MQPSTQPNSPTTALTPPPSTVIPRLFYFCYFAAMAALMPFLALYYWAISVVRGRDRAVSGIPPLLGSAAVPLWGGLSDATQQHRRLVSITVIGAASAVALLSQVTTLPWLVGAGDFICFL